MGTVHTGDFEDFWDSLSDGVVAIDKSLKIISFSNGAERITGYKTTEAVGLPCRDVFRGDLCEKECPVKKTLERGKVVSNFKMNILTKAEQRIPISVNTAPLKDRNGKIIGVIMAFRDITEVYRLTTSIFRERARLATILNSIADGVFTVDTKWRITEFNPQAETITGYKRSEVIGKPCRSVFKSNICDEECPLRKSIETRNPIFNFETNVVNSKDEIVPISMSSASLIDEEGEIVGGVEIFRDLRPLEILREELGERYSFGNIVGKNAKMQEIYKLLKTVSETSTSVIIQGETGTGKELVAKAIHYNSPRKNKPFVKVSCAALPETLLESELFGYKKGAFTGAMKDKPGRFEIANGGTVFLDEVGEIPIPVQVKLLRVLEEQTFEPLGGTETIKVDVRFIAATNRNLKEAIKKDKFREDFYYRLNVVPIFLPPLRARSDDIPLLIKHFIQEFNEKTGKEIGSVSQEAMDVLLDYTWPGNVRQLENAVEHAFVHCRSNTIQIHHLPEEIKGEKKESVEKILQSKHPLDETEKQVILEALKKHNWNKEKTAKLLQISRTTLWRKLKKYKI